MSLETLHRRNDRSCDWAPDNLPYGPIRPLPSPDSTLAAIPGYAVDFDFDALQSGFHEYINAGGNISRCWNRAGPGSLYTPVSSLAPMYFSGTARSLFTTNCFLFDDAAMDPFRVSTKESLHFAIVFTRFGFPHLGPIFEMAEDTTNPLQKRLYLFGKHSSAETPATGYRLNYDNDDDSVYHEIDVLNVFLNPSKMLLIGGYDAVNFKIYLYIDHLGTSTGTKQTDTAGGYVHNTFQFDYLSMFSSWDGSAASNGIAGGIYRAVFFSREEEFSSSEVSTLRSWASSYA